ncbi:Cdc25 phosphatase Ibp1 [Coemansia thaxteri]|uniref:Cdc25 phosphatase Ibp1 n=1 Tax=Coemansia thaxteri TaxID=2663907 RepID=A0A9W8EEC2_9FUNG|nr:Cdc25 phosphatase Ibp1 [Coemansia thaxteri]KAJ2480451.1 Cdc25 phosphatase Ibp1 [Coemansia sp. RSA 2320]
MNPVSYISADALAELVRDPEKAPGADYIVIDVRDADFAGGHIPGATNVPAHKLPEVIESLVDKCQAVPLVVFHCALSQVRGPKSARRYSDAVKHRLVSAAEGDPLFDQEIKVLRGGFDSWCLRFSEDEPDLVEGYDAKTRAEHA